MKTALCSPIDADAHKTSCFVSHQFIPQNLFGSRAFSMLFTIIRTRIHAARLFGHEFD